MAGLVVLSDDTDRFSLRAGWKMQLVTIVDRPWPPGDPTCATNAQSHITITWPDGTSESVPLAWLRDNCPCHECRISSTGEHRYFLGNVAEIPPVMAIDVIDGVLDIRWQDGHTSWFAPADFARLTHIANRDHVGARAWCDDFAPERFDRDSILNDSAILVDFLYTSMRDGMSIVTGMPNESGECIRFLEELKLPVRETPFDRLHDVFFRADGYNVAHTDEALPPHNDFASYTWPPSGQLIHMLVNEVSGGEWVNVDGFRVLSQLWQTHPSAVETLARVPVAFREHSASAESWARAPIVRTDAHGNIAGLRFSNQLMQPLSPLNPDVEEFYDAYHLLARAINDPTNQIEFRAEPGTMQFVHGHRVLHARRAFDGTSGVRHLQDTYFDFDDVAALAALTTGDAR